MDDQPLVNFFIIGAPKCGTTAMSSYLAKHPNICMSDPKEPYFFCEDFPKTRSRFNIQSICEYHETFFKEFQSGIHDVVGEASVWYLYSQLAVNKILEYNPNAKFLVMLRNPIEMINSLHSMYVGLGFEYERDLGKALMLDEQRSQGIPVKLNPLVDPHLFVYREVGKIGKQVERLYSLVSLEKIKIIIHDDLIENPDSCCNEIFEFLRVNQGLFNQLSLERINVQRKIKSKLIQACYSNQEIRKIANLIKHIFHLKSFNMGIVKIDISEYEKITICNILKNDIDLLSKLLDKDLRHWYQRG